MFNKHIKKILIILLVVLFSLTGCTTKKENQQKEFYRFTDSVGKEVVLKEKPERVAVLFSSLAQIWQIAGGEIAISVGDSVTRGFAKEDTILVNETAGLKIDFEALVGAKPDFVVVSADLSAQIEAAELMEQIGIPVARLKDECFEDYLSILNIMTDITGDKSAYQQYGLNLQKEIKNLLDEFHKVTHKEVKYLFIRAGSGFSSTKAKTAEDHFACVMLDELGASNIVDSNKALTENISVEYLLTNQPDVIIIAPQGNVDNAKAYIDELFASEGYKDLDAIKNGNYHFVSKELFNYKPNQNWLEAYKTLMNLLYEN